MSKIKGIKYIGPIFDSSGYAKACRGNIIALHKQGIPVTLAPLSFEKIRPDFGEDGKILESLVNKPVDYNVVLIHTTPEFWSKHIEFGKTNIGYTIWETDKLHPDWKEYINKTVDKVLVGCDWNIDVFKNSGVTIPIGNVPHGICPQDSDSITNYNIAGVNDETYVFYSIFQWTERKDPISLIKAYWYAFQNNENVALILKTYRMGFADKEKQIVRETITRLKQVMPMDSYPPIYLVGNRLDRDEVLGLHKFGDCLISLDRGEGFGLVPFEAGACGNPIVVTGMGGVLEFAKPEHSFLCSYSLTPVFGMPMSPWYRGDQMWAEPSEEELIKNIRWVFTNRALAGAKGVRAKNFIKDNFSLTKVGLSMRKRLEEIVK